MMIEENIKTGLVCRKCGNSEFHTTNTERGEGQILRRKVCKKCGVKMISIEKVLKIFT